MLFALKHPIARKVSADIKRDLDEVQQRAQNVRVPQWIPSKSSNIWDATGDFCEDSQTNQTI